MGQKLNNRYEILELIGRGGMGEVYKARDHLLERIVAVKRIAFPDKTPITNLDDAPTTGDHENFTLNEARMMARVFHPNILPIYDLIRDDNKLFIIMPLMSSKVSLLLKESRKPPLSESINLLEGIAEGLDFLHRFQFLHRDLKPDNIFLDNNNQPYIADFGLAQDMEAPHLETFVGTLRYIAPEVIQGNKASAFSDQFAFGLLAFEIITSHHAYESDAAHSLLVSLLSTPVPSIREARPELSEATIRDIDEVLARMTAKKPEERYEHAIDAIEDLKRIIYSGQQIIDGKLFISYSRKDQNFVYALADELERYDVTLWVDRKIEYGSAWDQSIDNQLAGCDAMLIVATPDSMQSAYVTYEWSYFIGANKPVFPFVPQFAVDRVELHPRLQRLQYIKGTDDMRHNVREIIEVMSQAIAQRKKQQS